MATRPNSEPEESNPASVSKLSLQKIPSPNTVLHQKHQLSTTHHYCIATLTGHVSCVSSITLAGKFLYSGSTNSEIRAWKRTPVKSEVETENLVSSVMAVGEGAVKCLIVSADKLFSAHQDHKIRVWKIKSQEQQNQKCEHIATLPTFGDRVLRLLNPSSRVQIRRHKKSTWVNHVDTVSSLAILKDGSLLYSVSWDRALKIWRISDFKCLESISNAHDDAINTVVVSEAGMVYTGSADRKIKVWKKKNSEEKHTLITTLERHSFGINALAVSKDTSVLYSGDCDRSILVWKNNGDQSMSISGALSGHGKAILCLTVASDLVCSGSADKTIRIWGELDNSYFCLAVLEGHLGPVKCLTVKADPYSKPGASASNYLVYSGGLDNDIKVWSYLFLHNADTA